MTTSLSDMTMDDLKALIAGVVDQRLHEVLTDPDAGLEISPALRVRLLQQINEVESGDIGEPFEQAMKNIGL